MSRPRRGAPLALLALVATLAACGGGSSSSSGTATSVPPAATPTSATSGGAAAAGTAWPTSHRDLARTGADPKAPRVTRVRRAWRTSVDGDVYAEPLVVGGRVVAAT